VVFENAKEANNAAEAANVLDVLPVLYADLQVDSITVPADGQSGATIRVSWTVSNQGIGITNQSVWYDRVYLASDPQGNTLVQDYGLLDHSGPLQPGATYTRTADLVLPNTLSGPVYVVVEAAKSGSVFEFLHNTNNKAVSATAVNVSLSPTPDLAVTNIQTQASAFEGSKIDITWTVSNQGDAHAGGAWSDRVVLRKIGDTAGTITVGTFIYDRGLPAGQSYTRTEQFTLPSFIQGQYQVEVVTDVNAVLFERNLGPGTGDANNTTLDPDILTVQLRPRPDLQVSNVVSPASIPAGSGVSLEYTIINQGTAATPSVWKDNVYLSIDNKITIDDILIGSFDNVSALDPGQAYTRTTPSVPVPIRYRGDVFLLVSPDHHGQVDEFPGRRVPERREQCVREAAVRRATPAGGPVHRQRRGAGPGLAQHADRGALSGREPRFRDHGQDDLDRHRVAGGRQDQALCRERGHSARHVHAPGGVGRRRFLRTGRNGHDPGRLQT
jgi:hypothetical protein